MKRTMIASLLMVTSLYTHAGWLDDISAFFSGDKKETTENASQPSTTDDAPAPEKKSGLVNTGLTLLPMIVQQLNVSESQATGGMGALLVAAQSLIQADQFSALTKAIPGSEMLIAALPSHKKSESQQSKLIDSAMKLTGSENNPTVAAGAKLVSQFSDLGLSSDMIGKFTNVTSQYLKKSDNSEEADVLTSALANLKL